MPSGGPAFEGKLTDENTFFEDFNTEDALIEKGINIDIFMTCDYMSSPCRFARADATPGEFNRQFHELEFHDPANSIFTLHASFNVDKEYTNCSDDQHRSSSSSSTSCSLFIFASTQRLFNRPI